MLCVSRDLFNEQAGAGGRLHERKLPMGDGEERKTPTRILEEEEAAHRQLSAQPSFSLSFLPSVLKSATIAITYYGSLISFTGSSHGRAHLTSSAIISICVYYVLPPSACSVFLNPLRTYNLR